MGLDITAYRKLTPAPDARREDGCVADWEKHFDARSAAIGFTEENWPGRSEGIEPTMAYTFEEKLGFRAGSYGGYNQWRGWLARVAGWRDERDCWESSDPYQKPFGELINFADNEGVIGPVVAAKLAKDFADNEARAEGMSGGDQWLIDRYRHWRKAFEIAADGGAVEFH